MTIVTLQAVDLTPYGKPAFGRLPTRLGKPAAGFPQLHSLDDDEVHFSSNLGLTLYRGTSLDTWHNRCGETNGESGAEL